MLPIRKTVELQRGRVVLRAWDATVADAYLLDVWTLTEVMQALRDGGPDVHRLDVEGYVRAAFWRLVHASLESGSVLPDRLTPLDRFTLLDALFELNDVEATEGKTKALMKRTQALRKRLTSHQGHPTAPPMSS